MMPVIRLAIAGALPLAAYIACFVGCFLPWLGVGVYAALRGGAPSAHRRPRYLATDEAGIGITMASGSRYLVWDDIVVAMNAPLRSGMMLCTHSGEKIRLNLTGYPSDVQAELWTLIVRNVGLHPASQAPLLDGRSWHARRGFRVSAVTGRVTQEPNAALPTLNRTRVLSPGLDAADSATQAQ